MFCAMWIALFYLIEKHINIIFRIVLESKSVHVVCVDVIFL